MDSERARLIAVVEGLMKETGLSAYGLAKQAGIAASTLNRFLYRDPKYILSQKTLNALCKAAGYVSYEEFAARRFSTANPYRIRITGYVGSEGEVHPVIDGQHESLATVECPAGLDPSSVVAICVKDDCMYPVFHKGWTVFYSERRDIVIPIIEDGFQVPYNPPGDDPMSEFFGKPCIVKLKDGRSMLRTLKRGNGAGRYSLIAYTKPSLDDIEIEWAAKIVYIKTS